MQLHNCLFILAIDDKNVVAYQHFSSNEFSLLVWHSKMPISFSETAKRLFLEAELGTKLFLRFVHVHRVTIPNTDQGRLWLTLHPETELARAQTLGVSCGSTFLPPISWKSTESSCLPALHVDCLFPWPLLPEVKQLVRARHSGTWMESCPFHWQTHTEALLFCLFLFIVFCLPFFFYRLCQSHLLFRDTHRSLQSASYHVCWRNTLAAWSHIKFQPLDAFCFASRHQQFTDLVPIHPWSFVK